MITENTDIRLVQNNEEIVDCFTSGVYEDEPKLLIESFNKLPFNQMGDYHRVLAVPFLFHCAEKIYQSDNEPIGQFMQSLNQLRQFIEFLIISKDVSEFYENIFEKHSIEDYADEVKLHTGQHYGNLFKAFDHRSYFNESLSLLKTRLERNEIDFNQIDSKEVLDQGCGGGRYSVAWKLLGAKKVTGLDFSSTGIRDAQERVSIAQLKNIEFIEGSVLNMPFKDESYDIVFSNGVLHHTENWQKGVEEMLRVLKSGGHGWLYLIENPGGIFWDKIEILRAILKNVNKKFAQDIMSSLGIPMNRVFYMLDHVMVPINTRLSSDEIQSVLTSNGACDIKRLQRGADFDRVEAIYMKKPFAKEKFGIGENRFWFSKK